MHTFLIVNLFSSFFLCGLIWTIQLLHYPSFHAFDKTHFIEHMAFHKMRISLIVVPMMLLELATSMGLVLFVNHHSALHSAGLIVVILIWLITFFVQVLLHNQLSSGYEKRTVTKLVNTNWLRTLLWSVKSFLGVYLIIELVQG